MPNLRRKRRIVRRKRTIFDIIFLDIDGVLWTVPNEYRKRAFTPAMKRKMRYTYKKDRYFLDPIACSNLNKLLEICPRARVVISSTWRKGHRHDEMERILVKNGVNNAKGRVIGSTPGSKNGFRGGEVNAWLRHPKVQHKLKVRKYVIIDDDSDFYVSQRRRWVHTDVCNGLTLQDVGLAAFILGERNESFHFLLWLRWQMRRLRRQKLQRPELFAKIEKMQAIRDRRHKARQKRYFARMKRKNK